MLIASLIGNKPQCVQWDFNFKYPHRNLVGLRTYSWGKILLPLKQRFKTPRTQKRSPRGPA